MTTKKPVVGELWNVSLELQLPGELGGFRPAIILALHIQTGMIVAIPLTRTIKLRSLPQTLEIKKTPENRLTDDSVALIFQVKSISPERLMNKIGKITPEQLLAIKTLIKDFLKV